MNICVPAHDIETWRDVCREIGRAENVTTIDAGMTVQYFSEPFYDETLGSEDNSWTPLDLEEPVLLHPSDMCIILLNLPASQLERRYTVKLEKDRQSRRCRIM